MKKLSLLLICLLCLAYIGNTQDWQPVKLNLISYFNNYWSMQDSIITNSLYVDSIEIESQTNDTIFHFNKITVDCDTCGSAVKIAHQTHYLKSKMIKHADNIFEFQEPGQMVLFVNKPVGFTWIYDSTNNLTAQITHKYYIQVFSTYDSVIRIDFQSWGDMEISKHYGIINYGLYSLSDGYFLVGTENPFMGLDVINYDEIFNFQVGDVYQYESIHYGYVPPMGTHFWHTIEKKLILSKTIHENSFEYFIRTLKMRWEVNWVGMPGDTTFSQIYDTVIYPGDPDIEYNCIPGNACFIECLSDDYYTIYGIPEETTDEDENRVKLFGEEYPQYETDFYSYEEETNYLYPYSIGGFIIYTETFGQEYDLYMGEVGYEKYLQGYVWNGDTTGYIIPDDDFLVSQQEHSAKKDPEIHISPNPASTYIKIKIANIPDEHLILEVYSSSGKRLVWGSITPGQREVEIDITSLETGLYILHVKNDKSHSLRKFIISR